jgi:hypothetical protein
MKKVIGSFLIGLIAGAVSVYYFTTHKDKQVGNQVVVKQISGEKIAHDDFNFRGSNIVFRTASDGRGEIETYIPKVLIPEAYNWMHRVHTVTFSMGFSNKQSPYYGIAYGYRINRVTLGGGVDFGNNFFGVRVSAGYTW